MSAEKVSEQTTERHRIKILCVGLCCLDIIQSCENYPLEDSDQRCLDCTYQRGGNASNNCTVLSQLHCSAEFFGVLRNDVFLKILQDDMHKFNIDFCHCPIKQGSCPLSTVLLSNSTGSRTIVHYNPNQDDLTLKDFEKLDLSEYAWIHFEGRNVTETLKMMQHVEAYNLSLANPCQLPVTISVEIEKQKPGLISLLPCADIAFVSKDFAVGLGYKDMSETLTSIAEHAKLGAALFNAWSEKGAMARTPDGSLVQSPIFPPTKVIDTLGAGDSFNAAAIFYLCKAKIKHCSCRDRKINENDKSLCQSQFISSEVLQNAVTFACKIAGAKIGIRGFEGIEQVYQRYLS